ncbi:MAG: YvcK family protein [Bacilli bacterium]|nr:YvcK family protein [Bacilli bacterium]
MKKISVLGGGTGLSTLLRGLKKMPFDISAIVSVCDDGSSTGRLREEFHTPAVGDIRKVLISLSNNEEAVSKVLDYRFNTYSDLNGHAVGNLLLTAANEITGSMSGAIELLSSLLDLNGKVIPLSEEDVTLVGKFENGEIVEGEHHITEAHGKIVDVYYKNKVDVSPIALKAIRESDVIVLSMGSLFTSILPNLICEDVIKEIDKSEAKIIYVCNIMTQPGETDGFSVSDHVNLINRYLGKRKIDVVLVNNGNIDADVLKKYETTEQKDLVLFDEENVSKLVNHIIKNNYTLIEDGSIRHDALKVAIDIISYLLN